MGKSLGVTGAPGPLQIFPDKDRVRDLRNGVGAGPFVAVHISARRPAQRWPLERYAALTGQLSKQAKVLLLWAPGRGTTEASGRRRCRSGSLAPGGRANVVPVETRT